jgi:hypothetical protein
LGEQEQGSADSNRQASKHLAILPREGATGGLELRYRISAEHDATGGC